MSADPGEQRELAKRAYDLEWAVLPRWVKILTFTVGLPAWLLILWDVFTESLTKTQFLACFIAFVVVCFVQICSHLHVRRKGRL
ncbi:hypothetical protein [Phenylobacterium sp.]|jgi:hypothetical protein|uniref:hypothetical protein n=1 Tax=Phenylobacterium sp. TaxID=1871053 RepID=UPI002E339799|nr:hypothetical protein [Phenylobacterium sp.]HEX2559629.1 hypothetical protein [Phenylobacterium sp.]